jgi:hypothetical protein
MNKQVLCPRLQNIHDALADAATAEKLMNKAKQRGEISCTSCGLCKKRA